jgi:RimJ/RimL family protein N-acetyltransferase
MTNRDIFRPEPHGHLVPESKLERYWAQNAGLMSLRRQRVTKFDPHACITYAPMEYVSRLIQLREDLPTDDWIINSLTEFVRTEYAERKSPVTSSAWGPTEIEEIEVPDSFLDNILKSSSAEISGILRLMSERPESKDFSPDGVARLIYELLSHSLVGAKVNKANVSEEEFVEKIASSIQAQERLLFVVLGFPFKDQNRFRVPYGADQPDFAELAFMIRLYRLTQALYQVHPFGVDIMVLSDGELYHKIFNVSLEKVHAYADKLRTYRTRLNLHGTVSFISLNDLIVRASSDPAPSPNAHALTAFLQARLLDLVQSEISLGKSFETLISAMKWNHESRERLKELNDADAWAVLTGMRNAVAPHLIEAWDQLHQEATNSALEYASVNLMLRWLDLIRLYFPDAIRCTIHPKPNQFSLVQASGAFAWNGVPWSEEWPRTIDDFEVKPFYSLGSNQKVRKVTVQTYGSPCFYTKASIGRSIVAARAVFPMDGWEFEDISGRAFQPTDAADLAELGADDSNFSWERLAMGASHYHRIMKFRIEHYEKYGFGVHGIWLHKKLIGQCGLQVLSEASDQVEFVIFLGQAFVRRGLGAKLTNHAIQCCAEAGMRSLYGVARPENTGALGLLRRVQAKPIRSQVHFGYMATVFEIPLNRE